MSNLTELIKLIKYFIFTIIKKNHINDVFLTSLIDDNFK